jgi:hypothetical protein
MSPKTMKGTAMLKPIGHFIRGEYKFVWIRSVKKGYAGEIFGILTKDNGKTPIIDGYWRTTNPKVAWQLAQSLYIKEA